MQVLFIIIGVGLIACGLWFAVIGVGSEPTATNTTGVTHWLGSVGVKGPAWLIVVFVGVGVSIFGAVHDWDDPPDESLAVEVGDPTDGTPSDGVDDPSTAEEEDDEPPPSTAEVEDDEPPPASDDEPEPPKPSPEITTALEPPVVAKWAACDVSKSPAANTAYFISSPLPDGPLQIRTDPGVENAAMGELGPGVGPLAFDACVERSTADRWWELTDGGWVFARYVELSSEADDVPENKPPDPPITTESSEFALPQTFSIDLDTGLLTSGSDADLWFNARTTTDRVINAKNGTELALIAGDGGYEGCADAEINGAQVDIGDLLGNTLCVTTTSGRLAAVWSAGTPAVGSSAVVELPQTWTVDLRTGDLGDRASADVWFEAATATERFWTPLGGAIYRSGGCGEGPLVADAFSGERIPLQGLTAGAELCGWTRNLDLVQVTVSSAAGPSPGTLTFNTVVWPSVLASYEIAT